MLLDLHNFEGAEYDTSLIDSLKDALGEFLTCPTDYALVYGSTAYEPTTSSDIDVLVAIEDPENIDLLKLISVVEALHDEHERTIDNEVPYENKLVYGYDEIEDAFGLEFFITPDSTVEVPAIRKDDDFLASKEIKLRLGFNALTSPHIVITSDPRLYLRHLAEAEKAFVWLAYKLGTQPNPSPEELIACMTKGMNGETGELYLGYKHERVKVARHISKILARYKR